MRCTKIRARTLVILMLSLALVAPSSGHAGGVLDALDFTGDSSPIPGQVIVRTVPSRWDDRCLPVRWRVNDTRDPIPNPVGTPVVSLADATGALQRALATWNAIPTSAMEMQLAGTVSNQGPARFDLINEVTFRFGESFGAGIALTRLVRLVEDSVLEDGDDLNGDGIPDVGAAMEKCQEVGGRTKFPAGLYKAGTILDADLIIGAESFPFSVQDADLAKPLIDLQLIATHEFGHALGLAHSLQSQRGERDARGAVMRGPFNFADPVDKLALRTLDSDDIAWASYLYPVVFADGVASTPKPGAVPFASRYGLVTGTIHHGRRNLPVPGGAVFAVDVETRELVASGYSGRILLSGDPETGETVFLPPESGIADGRYVIPLPAGKYSLHVKPANLPLAPFEINLTTIAGDLYGLLDFHEEGVARRDSAAELQPGRADLLLVSAGQTLGGIDVVTNRTIDVNNIGPFQFFSPAVLEDPAGNIPLPYVAVRVPASRLVEVTGSAGAPIVAALFLTAPFDPSVVQRFPQAMLTTGSVHPDGTASVDLTRPLAQVRDLVGRDVDFTPVFFDDGVGLGRRVSQLITRGEVESLFIVLAMPPPPYPGPNGQPPQLALTCHFPTRETLSYFTLDGATFLPLHFCEVNFSLIVTQPLP